MLPQVHSSSADYAEIMIRNLRGGKLISVLNAEVARAILRTHRGFQRRGLAAYFGVTSIRTPKDGRHAGEDHFSLGAFLRSGTLRKLTSVRAVILSWSWRRRGGTAGDY